MFCEDGMEPDGLSPKQREWLQHVGACVAAGISMKAYAERHGLDLQQFYFWKGRLKKLGVITGSSGVRSLDSVRVAAAAEPRARIQLSNGVIIEVPGEVDGAALAALMSAALRLP